MQKLMAKLVPVVLVDARCCFQIPSASRSLAVLAASPSTAKNSLSFNRIFYIDFYLKYNVELDATLVDQYKLVI